VSKPVGVFVRALSRALGIRAFAVGRNIQPGVPRCFPLEGPGARMALMCGYFGAVEFYQAAAAGAAAAGAAAG
jgi:uncharacterized protein YgbK (DUF1537 family)